MSAQAVTTAAPLLPAMGSGGSAAAKAGLNPPGPARRLAQLPDGGQATVLRLIDGSPDVDAAHRLRLAELGFLPGEPVQVLRRGPGGREPLAVVVGDTMFALRLAEANCVEVQLDADAG